MTQFMLAQRLQFTTVNLSEEAYSLIRQHVDRFQAALTTGASSHQSEALLRDVWSIRSLSESLMPSGNDWFFCATGNTKDLVGATFVDLQLDGVREIGSVLIRRNWNSERGLDLPWYSIELVDGFGLLSDNYDTICSQRNLAYLVKLEGGRATITVLWE